MTTIRHTFFLAHRMLMALIRQPIWIAVTLAQPIIWLLLFGALFKRVVEIPGFETDSYITFLTPGIVAMSALGSAGWSGMGVIEELDRGLMDRFLVSPVSRLAIILGMLLQQSIITVIQSLLMIGLAFIVGARFDGGAAGIFVLIGCSVLLAVGIGALSIGLAVTIRKAESLIAAVTFLVLPLTFLSSAFMQRDLVAGWIRAVSTANPVNWVVDAGRNALNTGTDWSMVGIRSGVLIIFAVACVSLANRAFHAYQRSV